MSSILGYLWILSAHWPFRQYNDHSDNTHCKWKAALLCWYCLIHVRDNKEIRMMKLMIIIPTRALCAVAATGTHGIMPCMWFWRSDVCVIPCWYDGHLISASSLIYTGAGVPQSYFGIKNAYAALVIPAKGGFYGVKSGMSISLLVCSAGRQSICSVQLLTSQTPIVWE